jgi:hypothetical protein
LEIRLIKIFIFSCLNLIYFLSGTALPSSLDQPLSAQAQPADEARFQKLITRLTLPDQPVSREGAGLLVIQAPGERYRLQFRLIARSPEASRIEIFDPFGRPMFYLLSYQGKIRLFSIPEKKEVPLNLPTFGPDSAFARIPAMEMLKIFWGRFPLFPYETYQSSTGFEKGKERIKFEFRGSVFQEIWITPDPFALTQTRITSPSQGREIEILFSDFSETAGNRIPMRCEIKEGTGEYALTIQYETLIRRQEIPDEVFKLSNLFDSKLSQ